MRNYYLVTFIHCLLIINGFSVSFSNGSDDNYNRMSSEHVDYSDNEMISGGLSEQNPKDPIYKEMAEESLKKYLQDTGSSRHHQLLEVTKVTTQVVAGTMTRVHFIAVPTNCQLINMEPLKPPCLPDSSQVINCYSEIWEQPWLNKKDVKVSCSPNA